MENISVKINHCRSGTVDNSILYEKGSVDADKSRFLTLYPSSLSYRTIDPAGGKAFHDGIVLSEKANRKPFDDLQK